MPIIAVSDFWKIFEWALSHSKSAKEDQRKLIDGWLDHVYADLKELSDIWLEILDKGVTPKLRERAAGVLIPSQVEPFTRLEGFYRAASQVLPSDNPFREGFFEVSLLSRDPPQFGAGHLLRTDEC